MIILSILNFNSHLSEKLNNLKYFILNTNFYKDLIAINVSNYKS